MKRDQIPLSWVLSPFSWRLIPTITPVVVSVREGILAKKLGCSIGISEDERAMAEKFNVSDELAKALLLREQFHKKQD